MPEVVAQPGDLEAEDVLARDAQRGLLPAQLVAQHAGQVRRAQAVLEAVVRRRREHPVRAAQLLELPQPLELRRVDDAAAERRQRKVLVHGVVEQLAADGQQPRRAADRLDEALLRALLGILVVRPVQLRLLHAGGDGARPQLRWLQHLQLLRVDHLLLLRLVVADALAARAGAE